MHDLVTPPTLFGVSCRDNLIIMWYVHFFYSLEGNGRSPVPQAPALWIQWIRPGAQRLLVTMSPSRIILQEKDHETNDGYH